MNIDVFLHKVHADIVHMKRAVTTINANMGKINQILTSISNCKLFDLMVATSEVWVSAQNLVVVYNMYVCTFVCMCVCMHICDQILEKPASMHTTARHTFHHQTIVVHVD